MYIKLTRPTKIPTEAEKWKDGIPRRISVNNLGVGGSNTHIILESLETFCDTSGQRVPAPIRKDLTRFKSSTTEAKDKNRLFLLSGMTETTCKNQVQALKVYCETMTDQQLDSLVYTLSKRWEAFPWRWSATASSKEELLAKIDEPSHVPRLVPKAPKVGFVFAGQGAQWFAMGRELLGSYSIYRDTMAAADRIYRKLGAEWSLIGKLSKLTTICTR
jgi:acyl transferase domain-containing protein